MDFRAALTSRGLEYRDNASRRDEIWICCPYCIERSEGNDNRFRLGVNVVNGKGHCFNCDWRSREAVKNLVTKLILGSVDNSAEPQVLIEDDVEPVKLPEDFWPLWKTDHDPDFAKVRRYILDRGVTMTQLKRHRVGFCLTGRYAYRVVFPVRVLGDLVGLVGRDYTGRQQPKYLNSTGTKVIYNLPKEPPDSIVLSEGIIKCLALERTLDLPSASLLGHDLTAKQEMMLSDTKTVYLWPDPDPVGMSGFLKVADTLRATHDVRLPWPPPDRQADELNGNQITRIFDDMRPYDRSLRQFYQVRMGRIRLHGIQET